MDETVHYEAVVAHEDRGWRRVEVLPFSGDYAFRGEQAAIDAARAQGGDEDGYRILKVTTTTEVVTQHRP